MADKTTPFLESNHPSVGAAASAQGSDADWKKTAIKMAIMILGGLLLLAFVLVWLVQGFMYWYATIGCSARTLNGYQYHDGAGTSDYGGPEYNLLPKMAYLTEREPNIYGTAFDVIPVDSRGILMAPSGTWWRTWGPIYPTYTYQDVANSQPTVYMRRNLLRFGDDHRIGRCDGKGPMITISEGSNYISNQARKIFGMNQGNTYKIYVDDDWVAIAEETTQGALSVTFRNHTTGETIGSSVLQSHNWHGQYEQWMVVGDSSSSLPYYVDSAATLLYAVATMSRASTGVAGAAPPPGVSEPVPHALVAATEAKGVEEALPIAPSKAVVDVEGKDAHV